MASAYFVRDPPFPVKHRAADQNARGPSTARAAAPTNTALILPRAHTEPTANDAVNCKVCYLVASRIAPVSDAENIALRQLIA